MPTRCNRLLLKLELGLERCNMQLLLSTGSCSCGTPVSRWSSVTSGLESTCSSCHVLSGSFCFHLDSGDELTILKVSGDVQLEAKLVQDLYARAVRSELFAAWRS